MRKAQRGGQIPKQQPSDICEIFVKMSLQFKKKWGREGRRETSKKYYQQNELPTSIFFPEFSIWCPWFSNLSHLALMNTRLFFSMPYVLWSLGKKMHPNNLFFMFWLYPIIIYILHSLVPICNVFTIRKGNKKGREKTIGTCWMTDTRKPRWKKIIFVPVWLNNLENGMKSCLQWWG